MELTPFVKKYIEDNQELLETDFEQFVAQFTGTREDFTCFLSILQNILNEYKDLDSKIKEYAESLQKHASDLEKKYTHVAGITPFLYCLSDEHLESSNNLVSRMIRIRLTEDGSIPNTLPSDLSYNLKIYYGDVVFSLADKDNHSSAQFIFYPKFNEYFNFTELYTKKLLPTTFNQMEDLYKDIDSKFDDCVKSIQWNIDAEKIANELVERMNAYDDVIKDTPLKLLFDQSQNNYRISNYDLSRKTKIDLSIRIPFDTDPNLTDWNKEFENWTKKVDKFKQNQEKSALRKQEKEAQRAQKPANVKITRKDVTNAIKAAGFIPSTFVYTNKYTDTTTYKYAFMTLTQDECDMIKTELEKTGANIKNVTCEQGWWGGRGAYNSLFVRVYN